MDQKVHVKTGYPLQKRLHTKAGRGGAGRAMIAVASLSFVTASISFTVTETKLFLPFREWVKRKNAFLGELFSCGYCLGHWVAFALVAVYRPKLFDAWWLLDYFLTALVIAWLAAFQWAIMCWLMEKANK